MSALVKLNGHTTEEPDKIKNSVTKLYELLFEKRIHVDDTAISFIY